MGLHPLLSECKTELVAGYKSSARSVQKSGRIDRESIDSCSQDFESYFHSWGSLLQRSTEPILATVVEPSPCHACRLLQRTRRIEQNLAYGMTADHCSPNRVRMEGVGRSKSTSWECVCVRALTDAAQAAASPPEVHGTTVPVPHVVHATIMCGGCRRVGALSEVIEIPSRHDARRTGCYMQRSSPFFDTWTGAGREFR